MNKHVPVTTRYDDDVLLPPRARPGSPAPTVVPGAASALHDLLLPLLLLIRCFGDATMYVWLVSCSVDAAPATAMPGTYFCC